MGKRKRTPVKKPSSTPSTQREKSKRGHDGSFQTRMEIAVLAARGFSPSDIVKSLGVTFDMAMRWSDRSEEVMRTGSVQSQRRGKVGPKPIFSTPTEKKKLYKKLKRSTQTKLAKDVGVHRHVSKQSMISGLCCV